MLAAQTLKKIQHLLREDKGSLLRPTRSSKVIGRIFKFHKAQLAPFFLHHKPRIFNTEIQVSMILISNTAHPENENGRACEINRGLPKLLFPPLRSEHGDKKCFIAPKIVEV